MQGGVAILGVVVAVVVLLWGVDRYQTAGQQRQLVEQQQFLATATVEMVSTAQAQAPAGELTRHAEATALAVQLERQATQNTVTGQRSLSDAATSAALQQEHASATVTAQARR